jgi:hypothetical protein
VGEPGVADVIVQHPVGAQALLLGHRLDLACRRLQAGAGQAVPSQRGLAHADRAADRVTVAQRERAVDHFHLVAVLEPLHRAVEAVAAQAAPGAGDLGPDLGSQWLTSNSYCLCVAP